LRSAPIFRFRGRAMSVSRERIGTSAVHTLVLQ
jgi:hypothetical protein